MSRIFFKKFFTRFYRRWIILAFVSVLPNLFFRYRFVHEVRIDYFTVKIKKILNGLFEKCEIYQNKSREIAHNCNCLIFSYSIYLYITAFDIDPSERSINCGSVAATSLALACCSSCNWENHVVCTWECASRTALDAFAVVHAIFCMRCCRLCMCVTVCVCVCTYNMCAMPIVMDVLFDADLSISTIGIVASISPYEPT